MSNHQIAVSLHLSEATIKRHLANIYPRIGVASRGEDVRKALCNSWISAPT
jgi:ATP/maltotriose-dependent transcriptional regulator MalT